MDEARRQVERRLARGDLEGRARWLQDRLRFGGEWLDTVDGWGKLAACRAAFAALVNEDLSDPAREAIDRVADWLHCPCEEHADAAADAYRHEVWGLDRAALLLARVPALERGWSVRTVLLLVVAALGEAVVLGRVRDELRADDPGVEAIPEAPRAVRGLDLLGDHLILPAVVLGWSGHGIDQRRLDPAFAPGVLVAQQAGGMSCLQRGALGVVIRLEGNLDRFSNPGRLFRGLRAMSEDPRWDVLRAEFPELLPLTATFGTRYDAEQRATLDRFFGAHVRLPRITGGWEAFLELDAWSWEGWRVSEFHGERELGCVERRVIDAALLAELEVWGRAAGATEPPRAFLLWENAD